MVRVRTACRSRLSVELGIIFAVTAASLPAQEVAGSLSGTVLSNSSQPQVDAEITVSGSSLIRSRTIRTDKHGSFRLLALPPGDYAVRISKIGIRPVVVDKVSIRVGEMTTIGSVRTDTQPAELSEVYVMARRVTVDPVHTTVGGTIDSADYSLLPADRDYKSIIAVLPHVNLSHYGDAANVGGSTGPENMYFVDGVNATSPLDAATGISLPHNFIRAVEIKAGGYEAQFGRALGGVVNAVTYSGSNELAGQGFAYFASGGLSAKAKSLPDLREAGSASYDFGWRLGGPLRRDRLWYSAAYNPRIDRVDKDISGLGTHRERRVSNVFAAKLTFAATRDANVEVSVFGDPTTHERVSRPPLATGLGITAARAADPYLTEGRSGGIAQSIRARWPIGTKLIADGSLAHSRGRGGFGPQTTAGTNEPLFLDPIAGELSGGVGPFDSWSFKRFSAAGKATALLERHTALLGVEYEDVQTSRDINGTGQGVIVRVNDTIYRVVYERASGTFHNLVPTIYLQDAWRVADRLIVSAGVRWSQQTLKSPSGLVAQRFVAEWQPRLGVSLQLDRHGRRRLLASLGRYYQQLPLSFSTLNYVDFAFVSSRYNGDPRQAGSTLISTFDGTTYEVDFAQSIEGLKAEHVDEVTVGYESILGAGTKLTARVIHRKLLSSFGFGVDFSRDPAFILGTPGSGELSFLPAPKRRYTAFELSGTGDWRRMDYRASYVWSRTWGNYPGLYNSDILGAGGPNNPTSLSHALQARNSTGLLPNDRTHVLKLTSAYRWPRDWTTGAFLTWASGTPINDFGTATDFSLLRPIFLAPRGSVGRTPSIWDLNLRIAANASRILPTRGKLVMDILHLGNPQQVVAVDQGHFTGMDANGAQINPNPNYLRPLLYQPPMAARVGLELHF